MTTAATFAQHAPPASPGGDAHPNFDIRTAKEDDRYPNQEGAAAFMASVASAPAAASDLAVERVAGVAALEAAFRGVRVENHAALGTTEIVSAAPGTGFLTPPSGDRVGTLRAFLAEHSGAYGLSAAEIGELEVVADYMNPAGNMGWVELRQSFNGIPVFQGYLRGGFTAKGELARTTGVLASGIDSSSLSATPSITGARAVALAAASVGWNVDESALAQTSVDGAKVTFDRATMADNAVAWPVYFPLAPGVARLAWATEIWGDPDAFYSVVDAETGTLLFRKNMTAYQTQSATYNVYPSDSPAPSSPTPATPDNHFQAPFVSRISATLIGNEGPTSFNNLGWITDGNNTTDGNNVEAGIDRDASNGVDAVQTGSPARVFSATYNPATDDPLGAAYQRGDGINMFYWVNRYHDATYLLGFTEQAFNFQNSNFGRGGAQGDRISAEAQDIAGTNNANFATPVDGGRGRMQMFRWTGPTPDRSGSLDADVMFHELTHGLSNRLHGNATGLSTNMARGMGEGWSDFYARSLLSTADENVNGVYTIGGWSTHLMQAGFQDNYYYGIRRFPYAPRAVVGSNGRPHSPLTFADIDSTQDDLTDGAYPRTPVSSIPTTPDQVHNIGEVWAGMLWEVRARVIARRGWNPGNQLVLQWVTDGMKLDPVGPTFIQARDAILAAAAASGATAEDIADIWAGFATRGLGVFAQVTNAGTGGNNTRVIESFLRPGDPMPTFTINDVSLAEGNAGTNVFAFTVSLANPSIAESRVNYATANGTASAPIATTSTVATPTSLPAGAPAITSGSASPYPLNLNVAGLTGTITKLAVRLNDLSHTYSSDLDLLLVGPGGQRSMFMSDIGVGTSLNLVDLTFEDGAPAPPALLVEGTYAPTDLTPGDPMPAPAPAGPYTSALSVFNGTNPNGTWHLYAVDDTAGDAGSMAGYSLLITTVSSASDYQLASGELVFPPGTTSLPVNVTINGDTTVEATETFFVNLSAPFNAVIGDAQGVGTILNDDGLSVPTAANDAYTTSVNVPITQTAPGVLGNDNGGGADAMTAALVSGPAHGSLALNADGSFSYTPAPNFFGADSFTYQAVTLGGSAVGTVGLTVSNLTTAQAPTELYVSSVVGNVVTLRWNAPVLGPAATQYVLEGGIPSAPILASLPTGSNAPIFTVAVPNGSWIARVHTLVGGEKSAASNEVAVHANVPVAPSAPTNLLGLVNGTTLGLAWKNTFLGGAPSGLLVDVTGSLAASIPIGAAESFAFAGVPGGSYTLQLRAGNGAGLSGASNPVSVSFPGACSGAPAPPERFLVYRLGSTAHVIWEPAATGAAPSSYVLHVSGSFVGSFPTAARRVSSPIGPGTYHVSVSAVNACGASAPTAVQTLVVP